ncbi:unnamed protein product [Prorocentrum cordatum]|uniref:Uncharacterized protein n=1 Tax=Prorocentrum cordatum TaxID=2364126 RepID=A0ABN9PIW0_9DINO|nr:unnamed protein product [Polarella glacialis]
MLAGGSVAWIYTTDAVEHVALNTLHSDVTLGVCEDMSMVNRTLEAIPACPMLNANIAYGDESVQDTLIDETHGHKVLLLQCKPLLKLGRESGKDVELQGRIKKVKPGHACCLVCASGTTGN